LVRFACFREALDPQQTERSKYEAGEQAAPTKNRTSQVGHRICTYPITQSCAEQWESSQQSSCRSCAGKFGGDLTADGFVSAE
jgi:hypothetical protein